MTREIKFRGLRTDGKGWVYGFLFMTTHNTAFEIGLKHCIQQIKKYGLTYDTFQVIPESVGQFTGRLDSAGVEIFEGDTGLHGESRRIVEYMNTNFTLVSMDRSQGILLSFSPRFVVIGNIHQEREVSNG
ncbi:YopX family protein [Sphingobacterium sp. lm-10]|uniref:YopX family protein n=1 Tax=Sphingobacterium sp. lm-10 TaxID=2944904 RepID=UPI00201FD4B2|nr:YopX family protein [Sphingobacterium sp. lm-10]MCL7987672.1 YopX family protein [Sphingobacterium sp. lm-10]